MHTSTTTLLLMVLPMFLGGLMEVKVVRLTSSCGWTSRELCVCVCNC